MGRSFGFSDAFAKRDRQLAAQGQQAADGKVWYGSNFDGDPRVNGRDPWVENEEMAKNLQLEEGATENADKAPIREFRDARGRTVRMSQDSSLGLHGQDITIHGERATLLKQEIEVKGGKPTGDVIAYMQMESGGTRVVHGHKVGPGRHRLEVSKKRYFSF